MTEATSADRVVVYHDDEGRWEWCYRAALSGEVLANGDTSYDTLDATIKAAERVTGRTLVERVPAPGLDIRTLLLVVVPERHLGGVS